MSEQNTQAVEIIKRMHEASVLVVGDVMLDRFVYGKVDRISPESPVPVLSVERESSMLGGAGNTLSNLVNLGCGAKIVSVVGDDIDAKTVRAMAAEIGVDDGGLIAANDRPTIVKTRFLAGHQQLLRTDYERTKSLTAETEKSVLDRVKVNLSDVKVMIISDYGKGMLSRSLLKNLIQAAQEADVTVLVDPKGFDYSKYAGADIVTPNKKELSEAVQGAEISDDDSVIQAARDLIAQSGVKSVVATRSQDGMSVITPQDVHHIRSASDIEVFDVSGAGDTVIATIAASLAAGATLDQAAEIANIAGSIVVSKVGTAPIRAQEILDKIRHMDIKRDGHYGAMLSWDEAREQAQRWKARGLKVGFTNGCFDILHVGHVQYLQDARKRCDRLIVGLNTDQSIRLLKGPERPVHNEESRARVLSGLGAVDAVVLFGAEETGGDNTACKLLDCVQPDLYFKGGDYTVDQIPEAPSVQAYGGVVEVMPVYEGHSTTNSIAKIRDAG